MVDGKYPYRNVVVNIPSTEGKEIVFIAMPFAQEFNDLYKAIESAVISADLFPIRVDRNPKDPNFRNDIIARIRTARIVVAVCSPEKETNRPNPNVMYELGYAESIGKSTIILTNNIDLLPSDLKSITVLKYSQGEEKTPAFIDKLSNKMNWANSKVRKDGLTANYYEDIYVAQPHHWLFGDRTLWGHYVAILFFAKDVHQHFQRLSAPINPLLNKATNLFLKAYAPQEEQSTLINDYQLEWNNYTTGYDNICNLFLDQLPKHQQTVEKAFLTLAQKADNSIKESLDKSNDFYVKIKTELSNFNDIHSEFKIKEKKGLIANQFPSMQDLYFRTDNLSKAASSLLISSDSMIQNLIQVFHYREELQ